MWDSILNCTECLINLCVNSLNFYLYFFCPHIQLYMNRFNFSSSEQKRKFPLFLIVSCFVENTILNSVCQLYHSFCLCFIWNLVTKISVWEAFFFKFLYVLINDQTETKQKQKQQQKTLNVIREKRSKFLLSTYLRLIILVNLLLFESNCKIKCFLLPFFIYPLQNLFYTYTKPFTIYYAYLRQWKNEQIYLYIYKNEDSNIDLEKFIKRKANQQI